MSTEELVTWIERVHQQWAQVPEALRVLAAREGQTYGTIAAALRMHKSTVQRRVLRARAASPASTCSPTTPT